MCGGGGQTGKPRSGLSNLLPGIERSHDYCKEFPDVHLKGRMVQKKERGQARQGQEDYGSG